MSDFGIGTSGSVRISRHARKRWRQRVERPPSWAIELDEDIWHEAEPVRVPTKNCLEARLYEMPGTRDMILCAKRRPGEPLTVTTAVYADREVVKRV